MRCKNCGEEIPDRALVCGKCGTPVDEKDRPRTEDDYREVDQPYDPAGDWSRNRRDPERSTYYSGVGSDHESRYAQDDPRGAGTPGNDEQALTGREKLANIALVVDVIGVLLLMTPFAAIPAGIAAVILGALSCRSANSTRAVVAIVLGVILVLTGMVLTISVAMLAPYMDEFIEMFYTQIQ